MNDEEMCMQLEGQMGEAKNRRHCKMQNSVATASEKRRDVRLSQHVYVKKSTYRSKDTIQFHLTLYMEMDVSSKKSPIPSLPN